MAHRVIINGVVQGQNERIVDSTNDNNFGVLFHDTKSIEQFQKRSGMEGAYKVEYQHHYINLVGRIHINGQRLDIAIPMAMYNYHQEVAGASVEFSLQEVSEANDLAMPLAVAKVEELEKTAFFKALTDFGIVDWQLVGMNSVHAHPNGIDRFSGTDLRADINHPGVNFPLSIGKDIPNFASIIQHKFNHAEIIHTEYRIFNGEEGGVRHYAKGRCLTLSRGFVKEPDVPWEEIPNGAIDEIFGTTRPQPPKPAKEKDRENYVLSDRFDNADKDKMKDFTEEMMALWNQCPFTVDISSVLKTNVQRGMGRLQKKSQGYSHGGNQYMGKHGNHHGNLNEINEGLFASGRTDGDDISDTPTYKEMRDFLIAIGLDGKDIPTPWTEVKALYVAALEMEEEAKASLNEEVAVWESNKNYANGDICYYDGSYYRMKNISNIVSYTEPSTAVGLWEEVEAPMTQDADKELEHLMETEEQPVHWKMIQYLKAADYDPSQLQVGTNEIAAMYWIERLDEVQDERAGIEYMNDSETEIDVMEVSVMSKAEDYTYKEKLDMLAADKIMSIEKLKKLPVLEVTALFEEVYLIDMSEI